MEIQELISRGRLLFIGAPKRLEVFKLVNGKRSGKEIARKMGRSLSSVLQDLQKMKDMGLIERKTDNANRTIRKDSSTVLERLPVLRHMPSKYFEDPVRARKKLGAKRPVPQRGVKGRRVTSLRIPNENEILEICRTGEDQLYEFKAAGTEMRKLTREIGAFANTKMGGMVFYGVDDDGTVSGSDKHRQELDQALQNSIRNLILPSPTVTIREKDLLGQKIVVICTLPWNRKDVYFYDSRVCIRKGTNVFRATPEEIKRLHNGEYVV